MKANIGPYITPIGLYSMAEKILSLRFWKKPSEFEIHRLFSRLEASDTIIRILDWIEDHRPRKIVVEIHDYDIWSADHTLALIILPLIKKFRENINSIPAIYQEDIPKEFHISELPKDYETNDVRYSKEQYEWIIDEMIWAFEQIVEFENHLEIDNQERVKNGLNLFGKYYLSLWN